MREVYMRDCDVIVHAPESAPNAGAVVAKLRVEPSAAELTNLSERARSLMREAMEAWPEMSDTHAKSEADMIALRLLKLPVTYEPTDGDAYSTVHDAALTVFDPEGI